MLWRVSCLWRHTSKSTIKVALKVGEVMLKFTFFFCNQNRARESEILRDELVKAKVSEKNAKDKLMEISRASFNVNVSKGNVSEYSGGFHLFRITSPILVKEALQRVPIDKIHHVANLRHKGHLQI